MYIQSLLSFSNGIASMAGVNGEGVRTGREERWKQFFFSPVLPSFHLALHPSHPHFWLFTSNKFKKESHGVFVHFLFWTVKTHAKFIFGYLCSGSSVYKQRDSTRTLLKILYLIASMEKFSYSLVNLGKWHQLKMEYSGLIRIWTRDP